MSFKVIKNWFSKGGAKSGTFAVTQEGTVILTVRFEPNTVRVDFADPDPLQDTCSFAPDDRLSAELSYIGFGRWAVTISWTVAAIRHVEYSIEQTP